MKNFDIECYFINHQNDYIRICNDFNDEIKTGKEWLKEYNKGEITEDFKYYIYEDDQADYYSIRIEMY